MKRLFSLFSLAAIMLLALALPHAAHAAVNCEPFQDPSVTPKYPSDGTHAMWCGAAIGDTTDGYAMIEKVGIGMQSTIVPSLSAAGVTYYLFSTRAEENTFWGSTKSPFYSNTAYCGFTGDQIIMGASTINVSIWTNCSNKWTGGTDTNVWMSEVTAHESGHAFDFAIGSKVLGNPSDNPSRSTAFKALVNADIMALDAAGHPTTCAEFGDGRTPSGPESNWPTTHLPAVCNNSGVENSKYTGSSNKVIAQTVSPYFVTPPTNQQYQEIWAQLNVISSGGPGSTDVTPATDGFLTSQFKCTNWAQSYWYLFGDAPPNNSYPTGCPQNPGAWQ